MSRGPSYLTWFFVAAALHGGLLLGLGSVFKSGVQYAIASGDSVELTLVEAAGEPAEEEAAAPEVESAPSPEPPQPVPEPLPPEPEMIEPQPESPAPPASTPRPVREPTPRQSPVSMRPKASRDSAVARGTGSATGAAAGAVPGARTQARPNYLSNPPPNYPAASKQAREQGVVLLSVSVTDQGRAASVQLVRSSGYPRLDEAARLAVQRWRFSPARVGALAVASKVEVPVRFQLK